jgi:hypothetical protein
VNQPDVSRGAIGVRARPSTNCRSRSGFRGLARADARGILWSWEWSMWYKSLPTCRSSLSKGAGPTSAKTYAVVFQVWLSVTLPF